MKPLMFVSLAVLAVAGCAVSPVDTTPSKVPDSDAVTTPVLPDTPVMQRDIPPEVMYQLLIADIASQRGQLGVAIANYLAAAKTVRAPRLAERAARVALFGKALKPALEAATLWAELAPENPDAHRMLGALLLTFGRAPEAEAQFDAYLRLSADLPNRGFQQVANQLAREQNRVAAMTVMEDLLATREDDPHAWLAHAWLSMRQGKLDQALASVDRAEALKPDWRQAVVLRARVMGQQGHNQEAVDYLAAQLDGELSDDPDVRMTYARLLTEVNQLEPALKEFNALAEAYPNNVEVRYAAGVLSLQLQKLEVAKTHLKAVLMSRQRMLEANFYLGRIYELQDDKKQALAHYLAVRHGEYYISANARAASLMVNAGRLEEARKLLQSLRVHSDEDRQRLTLIEGELLRQAGEYQAAFDFFSEKLQALPDDTTLRYARALLAERLDKLGLAEQDLRAIIEREPGNAQALNALGYTLADRTDRYDEALDYIQRALAVEPEDAAIIDSMGWVHYRMGNLEKARNYLRKALNLVSDPEIAAHLGEVLWMLGDRSAASEVWETHMKQFPEHEGLRKVMKRFGL
ncbi:FIG140336: TPR domain protein [hydrothermal vent metagenome]|uniref:FIG140336: TPR domain protein n=1 Tax=hydrothermal vent metagenome TaxID=652676 RepID=A0A3B1AAX3_9ZZZZ